MRRHISKATHLPTRQTNSENADEDEKVNVLEGFYTIFAEERRGVWRLHKRRWGDSEPSCHPSFFLPTATRSLSHSPSATAADCSHVLCRLSVALWHRLQEKLKKKKKKKRKRVNRKEGDTPLVPCRNYVFWESPSGRFQIDHAAVYDDYNRSTVQSVLQ
jgi:hypothetical protein